jgi:uncharacterized protein (DUF433 family)
MDNGKYIDRSPEIRGGRPRIAGTGVTVRRIVGCHQQGLSPQRITEEIPHLRLAQVHAALAYYYDHQGEIDADMVEEESKADRLEREHYRSSAL